MTEQHLDVVDAVERELGVLYRRAAAASRVMARQVHPDLEPSAYGLLVRIHDVPGVRLTTLAQYFGINKSSVSRQVALLDRLGLVEREDDPSDGRAHGLRLTDEGRSRLAAARGARRTRFRGLLETWPEDEIERLGSLLERYNALWD